MKPLIPILALGVLLGTSPALHAKITRTVEKTFTVQAGGSLKATTTGGDIVIKTADTNEVRISARETIDASTDAAADKLLADLSLTFQQAGNDVATEAKYNKSRPALNFGSWPPVQVSFTITVPRNCSLTLNTSGGDITVASVRGSLHARTSGGNLKFDRIDGDIEGVTSGGDINLAEGTAHAKLRTSGGNIRIDRAGGPTEVSTSGGDIEIKSVAQLVEATTSGGNIRATLTEAPKEDAVLSTSGGNVQVQVVKSAAFQLDASTSGGSVRAEGLTLTITKGAMGQTRLAGNVNGGGPTLKLRSSGGDITIKTD